MARKKKKSSKQRQAAHQRALRRKAEERNSQRDRNDGISQLEETIKSFSEQQLGGIWNSEAIRTFEYTEKRNNRTLGFPYPVMVKVIEVSRDESSTVLEAAPVCQGGMRPAALSKFNVDRARTRKYFP